MALLGPVPRSAGAAISTRAVAAAWHSGAMAITSAAGEEPPRLETMERELASAPRHGLDGVRLSYFWMLVADDEQIRPDRFVLRRLCDVIGYRPTIRPATFIVREAAHTGSTAPRGNLTTQSGRPSARKVGRRRRGFALSLRRGAMTLALTGLGGFGR
jgi:hypothetical protein